MANALPIVLLAGAAFLLLGKKGGTGAGNGDSGGTTGSKKGPGTFRGTQTGTVTKVAYSDTLGSASNPVSWTVTRPGDRLQINGAPTTYQTGTDTTKMQTFHLQDAPDEYTDLDAFFGVSQYPTKVWGPEAEAAPRLILESKTGVAPGLFSVEWHLGQPSSKRIWIQTVQG